VRRRHRGLVSWLTPQQDWRQLFIAGGLLTLALAPAPLSAGGVVAAMAPPAILAGMAAFAFSFCAPTAED
jgi:hypothetical protein